MNTDSWLDPDGPLSMIFLFASLLAVLYFVMIRPQNKHYQERNALLESLKKGDSVVLSCGIAGVIYEIQEQWIVLEVDDRIRMRVAREAVQVKTEGHSPMKKQIKASTNSAKTTQRKSS